MAIDLNNFILHSSYMPYPQIQTYNNSFIPSATIPATTASIFDGTPIVTGIDGTEARIMWKYPTSDKWSVAGIINYPGNWVKHRRLSYITEPGGESPKGLYMEFMLKNINGTITPQYRLFNSSSASIVAPTDTIDYKVSVYVIPNI